MYFATNLTEIQTAMKAKTPRTVREVIHEHYPDATIDCNNRAHAPFDGYVCPHTQNVYRGGEYLPFELTEEVRGGSVRRLWLYCNGEVIFFEGSKGQINAGAEVAKKQTADFDRTVDHVGTLGKRDTLELVILAVFSSFGEWGTEYSHLMRDAIGNPVVYKGTKKLESKEGEFIKLTAMIKSHWTGKIDSRKCTYINRPKVIVEK